MKILFIGDIVGKMGRLAVAEWLPVLKKQHQFDLVIANGENAAHGKGLTKKTFDQLIAGGIDIITLGNHTFAKQNIYEILDDPRLVRPINLIPKTGGAGYRLVQVHGIRILIANICGQIFMDNVDPDPFKAIRPVLAESAEIKIVDFHGEATSEKIAFAYQFSSELTAIIGTHTHVQTADERIINGCGFISDVGMTGPYESVLGRDTAEVLVKLLTQEKTHYTISDNPAVFSAVIIETDEQYRTVKLERLQFRP